MKMSTPNIYLQTRTMLSSDLMPAEQTSGPGNNADDITPPLPPKPINGVAD